MRRRERLAILVLRLLTGRLILIDLAARVFN